MYNNRKYNGRYRPNYIEPPKHYISITVCLETVLTIILIIVTTLVTILLLSPIG